MRASSRGSSLVSYNLNRDPGYFHSSYSIRAVRLEYEGKIRVGLHHRFDANKDYEKIGLGHAPSIDRRASNDVIALRFDVVNAVV
jgi:hypothetical protein